MDLEELEFNLTRDFGAVFIDRIDDDAYMAIIPETTAERPLKLVYNGFSGSLQYTSRPEPLKVNRLECPGKTKERAIENIAKYVGRLAYQDSAVFYQQNKQPFQINCKDYGCDPI